MAAFLTVCTHSLRPTRCQLWMQKPGPSAFLPANHCVLQRPAALLRQNPAAPPAPPTMEPAILAARILTGLRHQGAFKDLKCPLPYYTDGLAVQAHDAYTREWKSLVSMIKKWNGHNGRPITPSFLLEVMGLDLLVPQFSGGYP